VKIHIVCSNYLEDRIIPRMFTDLSSVAHFTISDIPDDNADVNYFSLYLDYPKEGYSKTKTAALFSHREDNVKSKLLEWQRVANAVDLRFTWSKKYYDDLIQYGDTKIVTPYIDRIKFNYE